MDTGFGPLLMTGQHLGADHALTRPASMARHLGLQARWWLSEGLDDWARAVAVLELVAEAATGLAPIAHADSDGLHVRRYDFGREIAVMWWDAGASTSQADLVTWVSASGEQVLVGFHPVRAGSPLGPVEQGEQLGGGRGSVVAFQDAAGRTVATGVVVKAATPDGPAHVATPLHVAVANTPQRPLTVAGLPIAGWVSLPVEDFGPSSDLARAAYDQQVGARWRPTPLDTVDLALVAVFGLGAPAAELGSSTPQVGQSVLFDGYPAGLVRLWAGDLGRTWQDVLGFIGEDPAGFLSFERAQLATAPAVEPFTELAARLDAVQGRIQEIHAAALAHRRDGPGEQPGRGGSQLSLHPIAVLGGAALAYLALGVTGPVAAVATPIALAAGIAGVVWVGMRWGQHLGSGKGQKAPAGSAGVLDGPGTVRGLVGVVRWAVRVAVVVATATALVLLPAAAAAGLAGAGELAQGASSGHTDVGPMVLVAGVVAAVVLWVAERKAESVRRLLTRVGLFVLGGVVGLGVGVVYGGWIGLVAGLVLVGPELLALAFTVIPEMLERQPTEWLRTVAVFWLKHGPPVLLRIGFLAGAVWLLVGCGECAAATAVSPLLVTATVQRIRGFATALVRWVGAHRRVVRVAVAAALVVAALAVLDGDAAAAAVVGGAGFGAGWRRGDGEPVAVGVTDIRMRGRDIAGLSAASADARPLSGEEFPNLARGPPEAVALVRITEHELDDAGSLIAVGLRHSTPAPAGVNLIPARVARIVERLIAADPMFADWWARLLHHINRDEHTGHRHDTAAADLAREYDAQWRGRSARDEVALRRTRVGEWDPAFLRGLAAGSPEEALSTVLDAQGMSGTPTLVDPAEWPELLAAGHQPVYRGIHGERAEEQAEQFRTGRRSFVGTWHILGGSGTNFSTEPGTAGHFARIVSLPNPFRPMRRQPSAEVVVIGYLRRGAVVLDSQQALERRRSDVAAARRAGREEVANLLADLGVWAALSGIDAIYQGSGRFDRQYVVLDRGAMLVESAGSAAEQLSWSDGGSIDCGCGEQHFGRYGAAGLLAVHRAPDGTVWLLMQRRSEANQHAGTWGLPGGARGLRETAQRAAMREAWEEVGLDPSTYALRSAYVDDHGNWSYTTVLAETGSLITPAGLSVESAEAAWVRLDELGSLPLHPGFAASWPAVAAALLGRTIAPTTATPAPQQPGQPGAGEAPQPDAAHAVPGPAPRTVLRAGGVVNRAAGFRAFWSGQLLSDIGTQVTALAVPLLAVTVIHASTVQVGLLAFFAYLSAAVVTLPAGAVVDRIPNHRNLLVLVQVARAGVMAWIPTAGVLGVLSLWQLYAVVLVEGALAVFFRVAAQSFLPVLAEGDPRRLREYNSKLATTQSGAQAALPAATAGVVGVIGAATTIVLDVVASLASAIVLARLRLRDLVEVPVEPRGPVWAELTGGLRHIAGHPVLKVLAARSMTWNLFVSTVRALTVIFLVEQLHAKPWLVGVSLALAAVGGVAGAILGRRLADRVGSARALLLNSVWLGPGYLMLAAARPGWGVALAVVALLATNVAASSSTVISMAYLQNAAPSPVRARVIAAYEWSARLGMPVGAVVGGVMATVVGMQWTLLGATLGMWAGPVLWLVFSPIRTVRDLEAITDGGRGPAGPADPTGKAGARTGALVRIVLRALARVRAALTALRHLISRRGPPSPPLGGADRER